MSTALARAEDRTLTVERARDMLAKARTVAAAAEILDRAAAIAVYLRRRNATLQAQNDAAEIRIWAERRLGELTRELPKATGALAAPGPGRGLRGRNVRPRKTDAPTLAAQGIRKQDAHRWQKAAAIPEREVEKLVAEARAKGERITSNAPVKIARQKEKAKQAATLCDAPLPAPTGRFHVIVIDPPWRYSNRASDITHRGRNPYPDMDLDAIKALPVGDRAEDHCILWLWTTNAFMREAFACLDAWGFTQKTILTWAKDRMGTGDWLRGQTEHCLLAVRGKPLVTLTNQTTLLTAPLREHSRKPEEFYAMVERLCPGTKLEMFARERREGWQAWGNEA